MCTLQAQIIPDHSTGRTRAEIVTESREEDESGNIRRLGRGGGGTGMNWERKLIRYGFSNEGAAKTLIKQCRRGAV